MLGHAQGALAMMTAARNVSINSNQFEILQLVGVTESCFEDTKILQFHPGQAIDCHCKVSSNGRDTKSVLSTRGVVATFRPFKKFHVRRRAVTVQKCAK